MPKPLVMTIEVEEVAFGRVFRTLDGMPGVVAIHLRGSGPPQPKAQPKPDGMTVPVLVLGALRSGPLGRAALGPVLERGGRRATSLPDALQKLRKAKEITATGKGRDAKYKLTAAGLARLSQEK